MNHRQHQTDTTTRPPRRQRRPASIGELAEKALDIDWDPSRDFKHCLRMAERSRNQARTHLEQGDLENAFMLFARAATIALDKLPTHPNYSTALSELQRHNLGLVSKASSMIIHFVWLMRYDTVEWSRNTRSYE